MARCYDYPKEIKGKSNDDIITLNKRTFLAIIVIAVVAVIAVVVAVNVDLSVVSVQEGDTVSVMYTGRFTNNTVFDTNYAEIAAKAGIVRQSYEPLTFTAGTGNVIRGFDNAVLGMSKGQRKTVTIQPADAYGEYDPFNLEEIPRIIEINRTVTIERVFTVPVGTFTASFGKDPVVGDTVTSPGQTLSYEVLDTDVGVELEVIASVGDIISSDRVAWDSVVVDVNETAITFRQDPEDGQIVESAFGTDVISLSDEKIIITTNPEIGKSVATIAGPAVVKDFDDVNIYLDTNHPLAGKTLVFDIEIVEIVKTVPAAE